MIAGAGDRPRCRSAWSATRTRRRSATRSAPSCARGCPADCTVEFANHGLAPALQLPFDNPALDKARAALPEEWGTKAVTIGAGGSIPIVGDFKRVLGMDTLLVGFALDDDRVHSPNEKYDLDLVPQGHALLGAHPRGARRIGSDLRELLRGIAASASARSFVGCPRCGGVARERVRRCA